MSTLQELRTLLAPPAPRHGVVVGWAGDQVRVATAAGLVTARATHRLTHGQAVMIRDGQALPRSSPQRVYSL